MNVLETRIERLTKAIRAMDDYIDRNQEYIRTPGVTGIRLRALEIEEARLRGKREGIALGMSYESERPVSRAAEEVLAERDYQVKVKGYTSEHDDKHSPADLLAFGGVTWRPGYSPTRQALVRLAACALAALERFDRGEAPRGRS